MQIEVYGELTQPEIDAYEARAKTMFPGKDIERMTLRPDGEYIDIGYYFPPVPFERIRRITGYLAMTRNFNEGKAAEERDRVKHDSSV